jgi:hypothetical protein
MLVAETLVTVARLPEFRIKPLQSTGGTSQ